MSRLYLLDTNILSHLVRQPQGPVADHIADVGEAYVLTSVIVACELRYGAANRGSKKFTRQVEAVLSAMTIKPLESDVERVYASIRVALERKGTPIGAHDMLIARQDETGRRAVGHVKGFGCRPSCRSSRKASGRGSLKS